MSEKPSQSVGRVKEWQLTSSAFHKLLTWLGEAESSSAQAYLEMRRRLVSYFDRKKCLTPEDLADETLNRVARRLEEEGGIESETPAKYCYIVARFVFMEYLRGLKNQVALEDVPLRSLNRVTATDDDVVRREKTLNCLERCSLKLEEVNRDLIFRYYIGKQQLKIENRRAMAEKLGISVNALSIRACRIRERLRGCVHECLGQTEIL